MRKMLCFVPMIALAQTPPANVEKEIVVHGAIAASPVAGADTVSFVAAEPGVAGVRMMSFSPTPVKGAPYSAEAINERVQTLADGNRITEKSTTKMYRDSEGRSRTETSLGTFGNWAPGGQGNMVFIDDPVSGLHYTLNPAQKTASKVSMARWTPDPAAAAGRTGEGRGEMHKRVMARSTATATAGTVSEDVLIQGPAVMHYEMRKSADPSAPQPARTVTPLGKRTMEGVEVEGTKTVEKFPAGMFGNERAIEVTTERWFSNDLKLEVLRKHSDPRYGETTFRLSSLLRGEQPRNLFEPPADYKVEEAGSLTRKIQFAPREKEAK